ncbi:MAG: bifunctional riboflavin kinase/FAD synthetase, partial [Alphaproteobacteria bacterium]|nr:bifunctional riboflavin kinase/FAD synthetase [Alphaproteobacteria bacterium]
MRIFRHYRDIPEDQKGAVVAVGNFDGVHRGHQALIAEARRLAEGRGAACAVLAFEPHPREFFRPGQESFRLTPFRTKSRLIAELGTDIMFALTFDAEMASMTAQSFVLEVLIGGLGASHVVIGSDFQFGKGRAGNASVLAYMGEMEGFGVTLFDPVSLAGGEKISSTRIRTALQNGQPEIAAALLGHWWTVESRVERGDGRGREFGFPTANMRLSDCLKPAFGIYAIRAMVMDDGTDARHLEGVANFGIRPMYETHEPLLETYLFDFSADIYGKHLSIELVSYLRDEAKFEDVEALKAQIRRDE